MPKAAKKTPDEIIEQLKAMDEASRHDVLALVLTKGRDDLFKLREPPPPTKDGVINLKLIRPKAPPADVEALPKKDCGKPHHSGVVGQPADTRRQGRD